MINNRIIPCLLIHKGGLVKSIKFKNYKYLGDPINTIKIFNDKEVDELILLDIDSTNENREPDLKLISRIASECFMPVCYGGGINSIDQIRNILKAGIEKVAINTTAVENPSLINQAASIFGSQSIVISIDVKKNWRGKYEVFTHGGKKNTKLDPIEYAVRMQEYGAGEILVNSIDKDGTMSGFDIDIIKKISESITIPIIACGGAGKINDFHDALKKGKASAVAAGSYFVFHGPHQAVLISYLTKEEINQILY